MCPKEKKTQLHIYIDYIYIYRQHLRTPSSERVYITPATTYTRYPTSCCWRKIDTAVPRYSKQAEKRIHPRGAINQRQPRHTQTTANSKDRGTKIRCCHVASQRVKIGKLENLIDLEGFSGYKQASPRFFRHHHHAGRRKKAAKVHRQRITSALAGRSTQARGRATSGAVVTLQR